MGCLVLNILVLAAVFFVLLEQLFVDEGYFYNGLLSTLVPSFSCLVFVTGVKVIVHEQRFFCEIGLVFLFLMVLLVVNMGCTLEVTWAEIKITWLTLSREPTKLPKTESVQLLQ